MFAVAETMLLRIRGKGEFLCLECTVPVLPPLPIQMENTCLDVPQDGNGIHGFKNVIRSTPDSLRAVSPLLWDIRIPF